MCSASDWTRDEMMTVAAARALPNGSVCFVGLGLPSTAANLALQTHAPNLVLVYESGTLGTRPDTLPLSIGDGILADTADAVVGVVEAFNYWLQPGRIDIGFLAGAQLDRFANINTTMIGGSYERPHVRLPGAGGAPEIAASCHEVVIVMRQNVRTFVEQVDFVTSVGFGNDGSRRPDTIGAGPRSVITDIGILEPEPERNELVITHLHPGVTVDEAQAATGWELRQHPDLQSTEPPSAEELRVLRALHRTQARREPVAVA